MVGALQNIEIENLARIEHAEIHRFVGLPAQNLKHGQDPIEAYIGDSRVPMNVLDRTIAVIDDDLSVLESLTNLLTSYGYKAESYESAEQYLDSGILHDLWRPHGDVEHSLHWHVRSCFERSSAWAWRNSVRWRELDLEFSIWQSSAAP